MVNYNFKALLDTLIKEGFQALTDKKEQQGRPLDFKITPYSLNTSISFKFDNFDHFVAFLKLHHASHLEEKSTVIQTTLMELSIDPHDFFYVNFFEKDKEQEV
jgi:hypothetical protein